MNKYAKACYVVGLLLMGLVFSANDKSREKPIYVQNGSLRISLSTQGKITDVTFKGKRLGKKISSYTALKGVKTKGEVNYNKMGNGGVEFKRQVIQEKNGRSAEVIEQFYPTKSSIRWDIEIKGQGKPWSASINTHLDYPAKAKRTRFWTAWGRPQIDSMQLTGQLKKRLKAVPNGEPQIHGIKDRDEWIDPLVPVPFSDALYYYGAPPVGHSFDPLRGNFFAIPIATIINRKEDIGLNVVLNPGDEIQNMTLQTESNGSVVFSRLHNRISSNHTVHFSLDLVAGEDDWRDGLVWMRERYSDYFEPADSGAFALGGMGAYSTHDANIDAEKLKKMDFSTNWKASFDFPYMGMFLPPVSRHRSWRRFGGGTMTIDQMSNYATKMKQKGFHVLNYFNATEFGNGIHYPPQEQIKGKTSWKDPNSFLYNKLETGIMYVPYGKKIEAMQRNLNITEKQPIFSWYHAVVMDPGDPAYASFLLGQARRLVKEIPDASGIAIDRLDWLRMMNKTHDDGITWYKGKPARSLYHSWHKLLKRLSPIFHGANQYIFINNHIKRLGLQKHADGIFNEYGDGAIPLNLAALLGINLPVIQWTRTKQMVKKIGADNFFQKYLYTGSFPMAPLPGNDHSILPGRWVNKQYLDYGPLFKLINKARWVLKPHVVSVKNWAAKANVFKIPKGYVVPVVYGGKTSSTVQVHLRGLKLKRNGVHIMAYYPGRKNPESIKVKDSDDNQLTLTVPLHHGCAMVLVKMK